MGLPEAPSDPFARLVVPDAGWTLTVYPQAGEAGGCFVSSRRATPTYVARGNAGNPERASQEAGRRAKAALRRYCAANRLNRLVTLTYGAPRATDPKQVREHVGHFFRNLREGLDGKPLPYVWVPEMHSDGVHFHVHAAVGRFVPRKLIDTAWGRGWVHIKLLGNLPVGSGALDEARVAAGYLSKYVSKTFTDPATRVAGLHRYDVAQGFKPSGVRLRGRSPEDVLGQASRGFGSEPVRMWSSADVEEWAGPPAIWAQWSG